MLYFTVRYDDRLVALSILVAVCASYAALELTRQLYKTRGRRKLVWLACGSLTMGFGIWAMHFIGMEAYRLPIPVQYDWPTVLLSIVAAVMASAVALFEVSHPRRTWTTTLVGSAFMGLGIASMHYIGMSAMRLRAMHVYSSALFALSVVVAIAISFVALQMAYSTRQNASLISWRHCGSALAMGLAIASMHYIGMAAVSFTPMPDFNASLVHAVSISALSFAGICGTALVLILTVVITSTLYRQRDRHTIALADNRAELQAIFDNLRESVLVYDRNRNIVQFNRSSTKLLGLDQASCQNQRLVNRFELSLPGGEPLSLDGWPSSRALRGEFVENLELRGHRKDTGEDAILMVNTAPIRNHSGEIAQAIVSYHDVTQSRKIEEARRRLASIVDSSEDAIIGRDPSGIINSWNAGAEKIFGYSGAEMIGQSITRLLPDDRLQEEEDILDRIKRGETVDHIETVRKKKNGQFIHVSLMVSPIRNADGQIIGASKIARNITDRKALESQLFHSQKMDAIGQLTGGIAHDFNNLLAIVIGNLDLLERQVKDNAPAVKRVQTALKASLRGADLTRRMLAFARQQELNPAAVDLDAAILNVLALASPALGPGIQVTTQLEPLVPKVFVDLPGLESALLNLIVNARDAMPQGGKLTVTSEQKTLNADLRPGLSELQPGRYVCVSISDTGHGMPHDVVQRAFEPFFTTKPQGRGTGLGLAMVYGFFNQSGGTVSIYSELGYGTTVSFYLPLPFEPNQPVPVAADDQQAFDQGGTVLIVDDEPDLLEIATECLGELGYIVLTAKDGASARQAIQGRKDIDLLLTDIVMPGGINGVELAQQAVAIHPGIKIIYCSGFPADALAEKIMPLADGPLLRKPYQRSDLLAVVRKVLRSRPSTGTTVTTS